MIRLLYDCLLILLVLVTLPKRLWEKVVHGKYQSPFMGRFGYGLPKLAPSEKVIWIHAVSVGEVKAVTACYKKLAEQSTLVISTTTETGLAEAKRSLPGAKAYFILPFDFSWVMRRVMNHLHPYCIILCESDFWYNMLSIAKEQGSKLALINGKISKRSFKRFKQFPRFAKHLFFLFDLLCVQSDEHKERFVALQVPKNRVQVTGNLKLEMPIQKLSLQEKESLRSHLGLQPGDPVIVIGSTHAPEEQELLDALQPLWKKFSNLKVLLVPRHPERFDEVAKSLPLPFSRFSQDAVCSERLILIDAMGVLTHCYQLATVAIVAGSYSSKVGGHNIYEPIQYGAAVFFGPHMQTQKEMVSLVTQAGVGAQVAVSELASTLSSLLSSKKKLEGYQVAGKQLVSSVQNTKESTLHALSQIL